MLMGNLKDIRVKIWNIILVLGIIFLLLPSVINGQSKEKLEAQRKKMLDEIAYTNSILEKNEFEKKSNLTQLMILKKNISSRESLISAYADEIKIINKELEIKEGQIQEIEQEIKMLKDEYAKLIYSAYKSRKGYDKWMFVLSSKDFNQAYRRLKYLKQFADYRKKQVELVKIQELKLEGEIEELNSEREVKEKLVVQESLEKEKMASEKVKIDRVISELKKTEKALKKEINSRKQEALQIKKAIDKIMAEEEKRRKEALEKSKKTGKFDATPEETLVSEQFGNNIGKFPWPTEKGIVIRTYGEHPHPVLSGIKTFNNGIDISTNEGSLVRAIFDGEVRDVWAIQGRNMAVIIKHGEFFTVYQNLSDVMVRPGDKVKIKQNIGTVFTDKNNGNNTMLHLEIWKGSERQNPAFWLAGK